MQQGTAESVRPPFVLSFQRGKVKVFVHPMVREIKRDDVDPLTRHTFNRAVGKSWEAKGARVVIRQNNDFPRRVRRFETEGGLKIAPAPDVRFMVPDSLFEARNILSALPRLD